MSDEKLSVLPSEVPDYHTRQAAHLGRERDYARLTARLLQQAEKHDGSP